MSAISALPLDLLFARVRHQRQGLFNVPQVIECRWKRQSQPQITMTPESCLA